MSTRLGYTVVQGPAPSCARSSSRYLKQVPIPAKLKQRSFRNAQRHSNPNNLLLEHFDHRNTLSNTASHSSARKGRYTFSASTTAHTLKFRPKGNPRNFGPHSVDRYTMQAHDVGRDRRHRGMIEDEDAAVGKLGTGTHRPLTSTTPLFHPRYWEPTPFAPPCVCCRIRRRRLSARFRSRTGVFAA